MFKRKSEIVGSFIFSKSDVGIQGQDILPHSKPVEFHLFLLETSELFL